VNIITLPTGEKWVSDVSFGGDGPTKPLPLITPTSPSNEFPYPITTNLGPQEVRLIHSNIPSQQNSEPKFWIYQYRNSPTQEWNSFYAFSAIEFFRSDFEVMNYFTSTFRGGSNFQTERCLIVKFLKGRVEGKEEESIVGKVMLVGGEVKRNDGGKTRVARVCGNEQERIGALAEDFGIVLTEKEVAGIKGMPAELLDKDD
jgi:arylamine N-acetyltransferase